MGVLIATDAVSMDEWAVSLVEANQRTPDSRAIHRYRRIRVVRGEGVAEYVEDLGPAAEFGREQFAIPGGVFEGGKFDPVHTVGELIDIAEYLWARPYDTSNLVRTDLVNDYHDQRDMIQRAVRGQRTFGPRRFTNLTRSASALNED